MASAVGKAFNIMWVLRRSPEPLSLTDIARAVDIAPSTAYSILSQLSAQGAVLQDSVRRYTLGPAVFYLGAAYVKHVPIYSRVWDGLTQLADAVGLTAVVAVPWGDHHLILDVHQNSRLDITVAFGGRVPLDAGAWGKAYFAWSGRQPETLTGYTPKTPTDNDEYARQLEEALARGYAIDVEEFHLGAGAVASAVTSQQGIEGVVALVGGVGITSVEEFNDAGRRLASLSASMSYALGDSRRIKIIGYD